MNAANYYDGYLLEKWRKGDEDALKSLIDQYQQKVFGFVFCLVGRNYDRAYELGVSSFAQAFYEFKASGEEKLFFPRMVEIAIELSQKANVVFSPGASDFSGYARGKKRILEVLNEALQALPFESRVHFLLREQLGLPYHYISAILNLSENEAREKILQAKTQFRKHLEERLEHGV